MSVSLWRYRHLEPVDNPAMSLKAYKRTWACGLLYNECALWVGVHYSSQNKRYCINLIPFLTFWYCGPGGTEA